MTRTSKYCPTTHPAAEAAPTRPDRVGVSRPRTVRQPLIALLPLAFLLVMTASCQREPLPQDPGTYIAFTPDLTPTKAPIESTDQISEFAVWAYCDIDEIMDNIRVYRSNDLWLYDDLKPWKNGTWKFYAFYPFYYEQSKLKVDAYVSKTGDQTDEGIEIEYFDGSAMNIDLMSAEVLDRNVDLTGNTGTSPVAFTFQHLLSRVDIVAKSANGQVEVTALTFSGMGVYGTYNHQDGTATDYQDKWTLIQSYGSQLLDPGSVSITFPLPDGSTSISVPASDTPTDLLTDLLLIPQTPGTDCNIKVTYTSTYHTEPQTREITLPSDPAWESAHRYVYTIIFNERDIALNINIVDWEVTYNEEVIW